MSNHLNQTDTETLIKEAAKKVFLKRGLAGTRLQEIADEAGIGRTALHYYFRNKEKLFQEVWKDAFKDINQRAGLMIESNISIIEKMKHFAENYFDKAIAEPEIDLFMLNEFNLNPKLMQEILSDAIGHNPINFLIKEIEKAVKNGELKGEPKQIFITLISVCIFSFAGKSIMQIMLNLNESQYLQLMKERKVYVMKFLETAFV